MVDNASRDGSADCLEAVPLPLMVLRNDRNRGFAAACNQGAALATAETLLFLNPDTRLKPEAILRPLAELALRTDERIGLVGIRLEDAQGNVARKCARFPTPGRLVAHTLGLDRLLPGRFPPHFIVEWDHLSTREVDQPMGAFLMVRRRVFEQLQGFDERFFLYYEDVDLALRARGIGWKSLYLAEAAVVHIGGGTTNAIRSTRLFYGLRSRIEFAFKHFRPTEAWFVAGATLILEPMARLLLATVKCDFGSAGQTVAATLRLWRYAAGRPTRRIGIRRNNDDTRDRAIT
ncbi:MAG: glycosyltransferase [Candidatus Competibacteraceae bacterium]|nr:glycosyltransferase [Candidatus Competibacteraceae bacterium]